MPKSITLPLKKKKQNLTCVSASKQFRSSFPGLQKTGTMATGSVPSQIIEKERKKLLEILQQDPDCVLDTLTSRKLISEEEYEILETITDPLKKSRKLLILVQKKGEMSCQLFLNCLFNTFSQSATICNLNHGRLNFYTFWAKREEAVFLKKKENDYSLFSFVILLEIIFSEI